MGARFLDHEAAETAIRATREYTEYLEDLRTTLNGYKEQMHDNWQGYSYRQFYKALGDVFRDLNEAIDSSVGAASQLGHGLQHATNDEHKADEAKRKAQQT